MKFKLVLLLILIVTFSCKNKTNSDINYSEETLDVTTSLYPESVSKVFKVHGGLEKWNEMQTLVFTMDKPNGEEVTTTDLKNRKSLIQMPAHSIGFDGENVWLHHKDTTQYKGNAKFYYNLMFYFYAMPFVLADDGIMYEDVAPLDFGGKRYPGIKISYESGIGESPEDEYILYYHPESYKMEWLGYTVTYFSKEKSKKFHFIKYGAWQTINGLIVPKTLSWYNYEDNKPTEKRNDLEFTNVILTKDKAKEELFMPLEGATILE